MRMEKIRLQPIVALANPRPTDYYEVLADAHATIPLELFFAQHDASVLLKLREWQLQSLKLAGLKSKWFINLTIEVLIRETHIRSLLLSPFRQVIELQDPQNLAQLTPLQHILLAKNLEMLRTAGFEIWLDDYHASYFTALNQLGWQFDGIKIDRAYFHLNRQNPDEMAEQLARVAIFSTQTIVEGIETTDDLRLAQQLNVQYGQGFYWQETAIMQPDAFIFPSCHHWPEILHTANGL
ncbi:MAG: EAL domain-containing protein [Kluyvera cryocrescens]|nr:EAL domain-containing protein [Kluyvera cryocrescens]